MPYEVTAESVDVLKSNDEYKNDEGRVIGHDHVTLNYKMGDVIADEDVSPVVKKLYDDGDEHTRSVLKKVGGSSKSESSNDSGKE